MLSVWLSKDAPAARKTFELHVGEVDRFESSSYAEYVEMVQADGDELTRIVGHWRGFPSNHGNVQRFYGDQAKYIVGNW